MKNIFNGSEIGTFFQWVSVALCLSLYAGISLAQEAGSIARVSGGAEIKSKDGKTREAKAKDSVNVADTVVTKAGGQVMIRLQDKSSLLVRENSEIVIEAFKFEKKT